MKKEYKTVKATIYLFLPKDNSMESMEYFTKNPMNGRIIVYDENGKPLNNIRQAGNINTLMDTLFKSWRQRVLNNIRKFKKDNK
jgi:hypothetical protein